MPCQASYEICRLSADEISASVITQRKRRHWLRHARVMPVNPWSCRYSIRYLLPMHRSGGVGVPSIIVIPNSCMNFRECKIQQGVRSFPKVLKLCWKSVDPSPSSSLAALMLALMSCPVMEFNCPSVEIIVMHRSPLVM